MSCIPFHYSGCKGNSNRFQTEMECWLECGPRSHELEQQRLLLNGELDGMAGMAGDIPDLDFDLDLDINVISICEVEVSKGPCHDKHTRYFYTNGDCMKFDYTGCKGNSNNFATMSECQRICQTGQTTALTPETTTAPLPETTTEQPGDPQYICNLPRDEDTSAGRADFLPRYYYDPATGTCEGFVWSGEGPAQGNRFLSAGECRQFCEGVGPSSPGDLCSLPPETGRCRAFFPRFAYHSESDDCREFIYGGCEGNDNRLVCSQMCSCNIS